VKGDVAVNVSVPLKISETRKPVLNNSKLANITESRIGIESLTVGLAVNTAELSKTIERRELEGFNIALRGNEEEGLTTELGRKKSEGLKIELRESQEEGLNDKLDGNKEEGVKVREAKKPRLGTN
jgi:hypothetical protein